MTAFLVFQLAAAECQGAAQSLGLWKNLAGIAEWGEPFQTIRDDNFTRYSSTYAGINIAPLAWNFGFAYNGFIKNK